MTKYNVIIMRMVPISFLVVIVNFILVTLIFFGLERYTIPTYVIVIPLTILYLIELFERIRLNPELK